jgi:esterase/lipase superfamily enzyme
MIRLWVNLSREPPCLHQARCNPQPLLIYALAFSNHDYSRRIVEMPAFAHTRCLITGLLLVVTLGVVNKTTAQETSIESLIARLQQTHPAAKVSAARQLAELGTTANKAAAALIPCLNDPEPDVRVVAAYALAKVSTDGPASITALQPLLSDRSEHVRYSAQWSVAQLVNRIQMDLAEPERDPTIKMLEKTLGQLTSHEHQPRHAAAVESVIDRLRSQTDQAPTPAPIPAEPLASADPPIDSAELVEGLYEPNDDISRMRIIRRLRDHQKFPIEIRKFVLRFEATQLDSVRLDYALASWDETIQADLASLLAEIAVNGILPDYAFLLVERLEASDHQLVAQLQSWSQDPRQPLEVRTAAINAISQSKHDTQGCVLWLARLLEHTDLQMQAANALSEMGKTARLAEPQLISAISKSTDESFHLAGVRALNQIAGDSPMAAHFVAQWLSVTPQDSFLLPFLLDSCAQFGELAAQAIPIIRLNLQNPNAEARQAAAKALQKFGSRAEIALPELMKMLTSTNEEAVIKVAAARAIGAIGPTGTNLLIRTLASKDDSSVQVDLLRALAAARVTTSEAKTICVELLGNTAAPTELRSSAANVLGAMGRAAQSEISTLLSHSNPDEDATVRAMCLLAAAQVDPLASKPSVEQGLESESTLVRASAAFAIHLCGDTRVAFDTLLSMLNESEADLVLKQALEELGDSIAVWLPEQAANPELFEVQRLACCELACQLDQPDWSRLLTLVEEPYLGQKFADLLSYHWHPVIACNIDQHLPEVEMLLELTRSDKISVVGRARLASLLSPDGLGAGDDDEHWGGVTLTQPANIVSLQQADNPYQIAAATEATRAPIEAAARIQDPEAELAVASGNGPRVDQPMPNLNESPSREVEVFYGTNRQREAMSSTMKSIIAAILIVTIGCTLALTYCAVNFFGKGRRLLSLASVLALAVFGSFGISAAKQLAQTPLKARVAYNHRLAIGIEYGKCTVSIPPNHQPGVVESPVLWKAELIVDPNKHVVLQQVQQLSHEDFFANIKQTQSRKGKNLLVFIHGYNVSFDDAAKRTAQMAFDLDFPGAPIFYSWPSQADWYGYKTDRRQIEMSVNHIKVFLEDLALKSGADTINLVAHSMGNLGLTAALQQISSPEDRPYFNQVVLAAPDIDAEVFKREIAPNIVAKANRTTLYTSKTDLALIASRFFNQGSRLGDSGPEIVTFPGIETIDATTVDSSLLGHSYYGSNVSVLTDVGYLLRNQPITRRSYLRQVGVGEVNYWTFDPVLISQTPSLFDGMMTK